MVEESTASTHSLSGETQRLVEKLRRFQMSRSQAGGHGNGGSAPRKVEPVDLALPSFTSRRPAPTAGSAALKIVDDWSEF